MGIIDKLKNTRAKRAPRLLTVKSAHSLTPNMRRITLHGDALANFPTSSEGAHIKLLFEQSTFEKPVMRTYTIAQQRQTPNEIDIDFMLHSSKDGSSHGIAAPWSRSVKLGDTISLFGPGLVSHINLNAKYFLLAADMTALPAMTVSLKTLPKTARGSVFIEILSEDDKQALRKPDNVEITWVVNDAPGSEASPLYHAIEQAEWAAGKVAAWVACEFKTMKKIRSYLKVERGIEKSHIYISSYWKKGDTEEEHKITKQVDADSHS
ncbi:MAG: NADPH-dependent ferric siderophore reductase [Parasphingorhabdus sp.]|jgi:NADPH-dependent ferric siderophore reductase